MGRMSQPRPISRRQLLRWLAASAGTAALAACRRALPLPQGTPTVGVDSAESTPPLIGFVTATPRPDVFMPAIGRARPTATPTATATPTPDAPRPSPTPTPEPCLTPGAPPPAEAPLVGLHASADPHISPAERCTFIDLRPSLIKVLSFHPPEDVARLAATQPWASWLVRTFLEFGGRAITPDQFVAYTLSDTQRTLGVLDGRPLAVELHNEPNLVAEGLTTSWRDGADFAEWWLAVAADYRRALPGVPLLYPALSPGASVAGVRRDHVTFLEESRAAVDSADALGVHLYWSAEFALAQALAQLDDVIARFPQHPIWITEASYNRGGIDDAERARQYLAFVAALANRPNVRGVTFFVASALDQTFEPETWVGKDVAPLVGDRR